MGKKGDLKDLGKRLDALERDHDRMLKQLNKTISHLDNHLYRRFSTLEKQVGKLEKEAFGRLSVSSIKAEQKRNERDLLAYVDAALAKYDKKKG